MSSVADNGLSSVILPHVASLTAIRRDIHRHPELMHEELRTSSIIKRELDALNVTYRDNVGGIEPGMGAGVIAHFPASPGASGDHVALRADMDALPIHETTGADYTSTTDGIMHACGHDGHTAILIGAARVLAGMTERPNAVTLIFQPAEEGGAGGEKMCRDGALDGGSHEECDFGSPVDRIYGLHGWPDMPLNAISTRPGPLLAATDEFNVVIKGRGGHAAFPHMCTDPVSTTAQIITTLQTIVSRETRPTDAAVLTVTSIHGGSAYNVIPDEVKFRGTYRSLEHETRAAAKARFFELVTGMARAMNCEAAIDWRDGYPPTTNTPAEAERVLGIARAAFGDDAAHIIPEPFMGGEDFAYYGLRVPACFFTLGLCPPDADPASQPKLHQPAFDFNDDAIARGVEMMARLAVSPASS